jgi:hypothetical protein
MLTNTTPTDHQGAPSNARQKHCIHMEQPVWDQAMQTARSLGLSTSQFLSRLVAETRGAIKSGSLLEPKQNQPVSLRP